MLYQSEFSGSPWEVLTHVPATASAREVVALDEARAEGMRVHRLVSPAME